MPLPKPRGGKRPESKNDFLQRCHGDPIARKEFEDPKQLSAYCYSAWERRKAKASCVIKAADDEYIYAVYSMMLTEPMAKKIKGMPESGAGYHNAKLKFKNGKSYVGKVMNCQDFECDDEDLDEENPDEMDDIELFD